MNGRRGTKSNGRGARPKRNKKSASRVAKSAAKAQTTVRYQPPFGTSFRTHLTYAQYVDFSFSVANTAYMYQFNANSVYDPDRTGAGHQPYGHDQLALMFNKYRVFKFRYLCEVIPGNDTSNSTVEWGTTVRNGTYSVSYPEVFELPFVKTVTLTNNATPKKLRGQVDLTRINERPLSYITDDRTASDCTSSPAEVILFTFFGISNQANVCRVRVTLIYDVEYYDPLPLGASVPEPLAFPGRNAILSRSERVQSYPMPVNPKFVPLPVLSKTDWDKRGNPIEEQQ